MKKLVCMFLSFVMCIGITANARIVPQEELQKMGEYYYYSEEHCERMFKVCNIKQNSATGEISFLEEMTLEGEEPEFPDLVYIIDDDTDILESLETFQAFASGELPWLTVCISREDIYKIRNEGLRKVHVACASFMSSGVEFYPSPEEIKRNERLKNYGIMVGDENGNFNPYLALTRAELTKIAVVMSNPDFMKDVNLNGQSFSDVSSEHWAHPYIEYAKANGIIDGYEDGTFKPEQYVTVQEMLKMMVCLLGYEPQAEVTGGYPHGYIKSAMRLGLLEGITVQYDTYTIRTETADVINKVLDTPLMVQTGEDTWVICDGSALEYPLSTIAIKNFAE